MAVALNPSFRTILSQGGAAYHRVGGYLPYTGETHMLWTIAMILIILWILGMVSSYTAGGLIHILLVVAIIVILVRVIQGRKVL